MFFGTYWNAIGTEHPFAGNYILGRTYHEWEYKCFYCCKIFYSEQAYDQHLQDAQAHKIYCHRCHLNFLSLDGWKTHMDDNHRGPYIFCDRVFTKVHAFVQHHKDAPAHEPEGYCEDCQESWYGYEAIYNHMDAFEEHDVVFPCEVCETELGSLAAKDTHMNRCHSSSMADRSQSQTAISDPIRFGHHNHPSRLYRVSYDGQNTYRGTDQSFEARSSRDPSVSTQSFRKTLNLHLSWRKVDSPFISVFANKTHAENWARQRNGKVVIHVIDTADLGKYGHRIWKVSDIAATVNLSLNNPEFHADEWIFYDRIDHRILVGRLPDDY